MNLSLHTSWLFGYNCSDLSHLVHYTYIKYSLTSKSEKLQTLHVQLTIDSLGKNKIHVEWIKSIDFKCTVN